MSPSALKIPNFSLQILPSLQSFCLYAAVGVLVTYIFQATFFVACFVIDERRLQMSRNGILVCIKHNDYKPNSCSQVNYSKKVFNAIYANCIFSLPGKVSKNIYSKLLNQFISFYNPSFLVCLLRYINFLVHI